MASVNKVILIGALGRDPEMRYMPSGDAMANLSVATSEHWKDKGGEKQERTEWHRVVCFGKQAETIGKHFQKGSQIYIEGKLQTRKWTDKSNVEHYTTEIVLDRFQFMGGKREGSSTQQQNNAPQSHPGSGFDDLEGDIPF